MGGTPTAVCSASAEFTATYDCEPNACEITTLPLGVTTDACQGATTGMECTGACRAGYAEDSASFSCSSSGSFEGDLACSLVQLDLEYDDQGDASATRELSMSVSQNAEQLVSELGDPSSAASQAVATSFMGAMGLPDTAQVVVGGATLQRRLTHQRRLQQSLSANIEFSGVSAGDIESLDSTMESEDATNAMGAHLEQNLAQVEGIDVGSVQFLSMQSLPEVVPDAGGGAGGGTGGGAGFDADEEPEDNGCAHWDHF